MAINFSRLFTTAGKIIGGLNEVNTYRGTTLAARVSTLASQYSSVNQSSITGLYDAQTASKSSFASWISYLSTLLSNTIQAEVKNDRFIPSLTISTALTELVRQMVLNSSTLDDSPCTIPSPSTVSATGTPSWVVTAKDGSGVVSDLVIPDTYIYRVVNDGSNGGTEWAETLTLIGKAADPAATDDTYPNGSGVNTSFRFTDPATAQMIQDPSFDSWTSNTPNRWTIVTGTAGVNISKATDDPRDGSDGFCLDLLDDGTTLKLRQEITVAASSVYVVHFRVKPVVKVGSGTVRIRLVDEDGNILSDPQSSALSLSSGALSTLASSWANVYTAVFVTPVDLPDTVYMEIVYVPGTASDEVKVDFVNMVKPSPLYTGGPIIVGWSGLVAAVQNDQWSQAVTLTSGTISGSLIRGLDRLINLRQYLASGIRIPTSASPSISDSLVS